MHEYIEMFDGLEKLLAKDIKTVVTNGDISPEDYKHLDCAVDIFKDAETAKAMLESKNYQDDISFANSSYMGGNSTMMYPPMYGNSYDMGGNSMPRNTNSYMRGRSATTGRYVSRDDETSARLNQMLMETSDPQERTVINRLLNEMGR